MWLRFKARMKPGRIRPARAWLAAVSALAAACSGEPAPVQPAVTRVRAVVVVAVPLPDEVRGFGSLSYASKVDVSSPYEAVVESMPFREGERVMAGEVVARLRNAHASLAVGRAEDGVAQAEAAVALADARLFEGRLAAESRLLGIERSRLELDQARRELSESERKQAGQESLFNAGGLPEESMRSGRFSIESGQKRIAVMEKDLEISLVGLRDQDLSARGIVVPADPAARNLALSVMSTASLAAERAAAAANLAACINDLESARLAVSELTILAPAAGVIGARYVEPGERAGSDEALVTIMDVGSLDAVATVGESDAVRLSAGMKATVMVDATGTSIYGSVSLVSPVADARSASFLVRVSIRDPSGRLKPGMFSRITVTAGPPGLALVVPEDAVIDRADDSASVFVVAGETVHRRRIALGEPVEAGRVVLSGLVAGEVVVARPDPGLKEGDHVAVFE